MNSRERFEAAMNHEEPDRVPVDMGKHIGSIHKDAYVKLRDYLEDSSMQNQKLILDRMAQTVVPDENLLQRFQIDFRWIVPHWVEVKEVVGKDAYIDMWGVTYTSAGDYYAITDSPLKNATLADLDAYDWPDPHHPQMLTGLGEQAQDLFENTDYVVGADTIKGGILTTALAVRGFEPLLMDMIADTVFAEALFDRIYYLYKEMWTDYLKAVGSFVQLVYITDDLGTQDSLLISPELFRGLIKPRLASLIQHIKSLANVRVMFHTDGAILPVIEDIIEMGVDILNPVQTSTKGMDDTWVLNQKYGDRLSFHGAIDVQQVLPGSTEKELRYEVAKRINDLGQNGGYILAPCHNIGHDISPANVVTLFEAAQEYGQYPLQLDSILNQAR